jgi:tRNA A37 threonylcarbamoyladenosine synthetase subunit TsaC/SUA5/YrdC
VKCQIGGKIDFVIEDGRRSPGRESTIVSVMGKTPVVLREGAVPRCEIEKACAQFCGARVSDFYAEEEETTRLRRNA